MGRKKHSRRPSNNRSYKMRADNSKQLEQCGRIVKAQRRVFFANKKYQLHNEAKLN